MADITMCQNNKCKKRNKCYRFIAIPDKLYQSYFIEKDEKNCKNFLKATKIQQKRYNEIIKINEKEVISNE